MHKTIIISPLLFDFFCSLVTSSSLVWCMQRENDSRCNRMRIKHEKINESSGWRRNKEENTWKKWDIRSLRNNYHHHHVFKYVNTKEDIKKCMINSIRCVNPWSNFSLCFMSILRKQAIFYKIQQNSLKNNTRHLQASKLVQQAVVALNWDWKWLLLLLLFVHQALTNDDVKYKEKKWI